MIIIEQFQYYPFQMTQISSVNSKIRLLFHCLGLGCLSGSIFLQTIVFFDILQRGYFLAIEQNMIILCLEIALTGFTIIYFLFIIKTVILQNRMK